MNKGTGALRHTKAVALLFVLLLLVFQFTYSIHDDQFASMSTGIPSPYPVIQEGTHAIEAALLKTDDRRPSVGFLSMALLLAWLAHVCLTDYSYNSRFYHRDLPDHRKEIKRIKPHFLNGSTYKGRNLIIYLLR